MSGLRAELPAGLRWRTGRWPPFALLCAAVLIVHGVFLAGWHRAAAPVLPWAGALRAQVHWVAAVPPETTAAPDQPVVPRATGVHPTSPPSTPRPTARSRGAASAPSRAAAPPAAGELPVYPTRLPPSGSWQFQSRRGREQGEAVLRWTQQAGGYQAELLSTAEGREALRWTSQGAIDAAGLAPERFVDRRRGRGAQAANFQRDLGKITFSGPAIEHALPRGAQDRLSALLQLGAIVAHQPARFAPGEEIRLWVAGAHGDADVWRFRVLGLEPLSPAGPRLLKLRRDPERPYDTVAEVWLDPADHYLPVQWRFRNGPYVQELTRSDQLPSMP